MSNMEDMVNKNERRISVVIPAYNAGRYIERAIRSVLAQTRSADEIVVVDDGSTDDTGVVVRGFSDKVILIEQSNKGVSSARNTGIKAAKGNWIAFLDADDEWLPEKLQLQCEHLQRNPELSWTTGTFYNCACEQNHKKTERISVLQKKEISEVLMGKEFFDSYFQAFALQAGGHINAMLIRKDVLLKAGLFQMGQKIGEDDDLFLRLAYMGLFLGIVWNPVLIYHLGAENRATQRHNQVSHIQTFLERHFILSREAGMAAEFNKCATAHLSYWIRKLLDRSNGKDVRFLIKKYGGLLNKSFYLSVYCGSFFPEAWNYKEKIKEQFRSVLRRN